MQLSFNKRNRPDGARFRPLSDLRAGERGVLESIDLSGDDARRIMELGFLPGTSVAVGGCAPGGDPRVYRVDGSEIALRHETAARLKVRCHDPAPAIV